MNHSPRERINLGFLPSDGERLQSYVQRLKDLYEQIRHSYAPVHEKWYTHYSAGACWICDVLDVLDYIIGTMEDIAHYDKKHKWVCYRPTESHDSLTFTFKPIAKV